VNDWKGSLSESTQKKERKERREVPHTTTYVERGRKMAIRPSIILSAQQKEREKKRRGTCSTKKNQVDRGQSKRETPRGSRKKERREGEQLQGTMNRCSSL